MKNNYTSASAILDFKLTPEEVEEFADAARILTPSSPPQLSVKQAIEAAKKHSKVKAGGFGFSSFLMYDRRSEGLHPTRNDIDKHGRPNRKKKGSPKPKEWYK